MQALLDDIMAVTRADSDACSTDSSQTQQTNSAKLSSQAWQPNSANFTSQAQQRNSAAANAETPSKQAQSVPLSAVIARPSLGAEESTAQHDCLQDDAGAHHQGCPGLQAASMLGEDLLPWSQGQICSHSHFVSGMSEKPSMSVCLFVRSFIFPPVFPPFCICLSTHLPFVCPSVRVALLSVCDAERHWGTWCLCICLQSCP